MAYSLVINKKNLVNLGNGNNRFVYTFPSAQEFKNQSVAISQISIYYCWQNITSQLGNNLFQYRFLTNSGSGSFDVVIPDGNYEIKDLNTVLHAMMMKNGHYLLDSTGTPVFYMQFSLLTTQYAVALLCTVLPTSLPGGWSYPSNKTFTLQNAFVPQLYLSSSMTGFASIIGFTAGKAYPTDGTTTTSVSLSTTVPDVSPIQCLMFQCNLTNNPFSQVPSIIYATTNNDALYGSLIPSTIFTPLYSNITDGYYQSLEIAVVDQNLSPVNLLDPDIVIMVQIKKN